jgi:asparagine synthetase B (glutamine-hydrolysing)
VHYSFDVKQHKSTYDDWIIAFEHAIAKRTRNTEKKIFLGLSSGYDSGAIACELTKQKVDFKAYTVRAAENKEVYKARHARLANGTVMKPTVQEYKATKAWVCANCEGFEYRDRFGKYDILGDKATYGVALVCGLARDEGYRIYLSGQGSDEILSDYGFAGKKHNSHSQFGGLFPENLNGFFPWHSFFDGTQIKYLNKEEYVAGAFGIETRYPFLDRDLVQEFLWLSSRLKNANYKAPLREYFVRNAYPFDEGVKKGFRAKDNLK